MASNSTPPSTAFRGDTGLPDFAHPPVDETALSLQFAPIPGFNIQHFGLFYARVRNDYPRVEIHQPITNLTEMFGPARPARQPQFALAELPEIRSWFLDQAGSRLIQVQRDRFAQNWRKVTGTETYPRYPALRASFEKEWQRFCDFLSDEKLERPKVNQCEVTYVNHIEYDKGWSGYGELDKVVAALATPNRKNRWLPDPERINMQVTYRLEQDAGRLYASFVPVIRGRDSKEVLQMTLTARGAPQSEDVLAWLDMGRRWVVRGFADFTTTEMQRIWGKQ